MPDSINTRTGVGIRPPSFFRRIKPLWPAYTLRLIALSYIALFIILPILAITTKAFGDGVHRFFVDLAQPEAIYSINLTFYLAFIMILINIVTGVATAWVMVRYEFPGKSIVNALIDMPFALPTVVTGLMLIVIYGPQNAFGRYLSSKGVEIMYAKPGIIIALLFVTFPYVVRAVQPVLMELDRDMEQAATTLGASRWTIFWRIIIPSILPAILTGGALAFSRALGEFGSVVMVAGNIPMKTQVAPVFIYGEIESYNPRGAPGVSVVLLAGSLVVLVILYLLQKLGSKGNA